nr:WAT1-related protein At3g28050-like isoform X4 [Ipomoea trifida]
MAMSRGLSSFILALYGDLLSTLISLPFAFIFSRSNNFPVTFAVLCKIFLLALVGYGDAQPRSRLYVRACSYTKAAILKVYPAKMMILCFYFLFLTIQSALVSLVTVRDWSAWKIYPGITLFVVLLTGCTAAFRFYLISWCIGKEGPLFVSMFKPLAILVSAVVGVIWFSDTLYLGSIIGGVIIVVGFYAVMWGKSKENITKVEMLGNSASSSQNAPLLQVHTQN